jgi:hypothetical protein
VGFLCSTGLVKKSYSINPDGYVVVKGEWDKFIHEQSIEDNAEKKYWFINVGRKEKLQHIALDQFNEGKCLVKPLKMVSFQKKFHKQLAELMFMFCDDCLYGECTTAGKSIEDEEEEEEIIVEEKAVVLQNAQHYLPCLVKGKK